MFREGLIKGLGCEIGAEILGTSTSVVRAVPQFVHRFPCLSASYPLGDDAHSVLLLLC